jgi:hypothetical protein
MAPWIKISALTKTGYVNTWHDTMNKPIEEIINENKQQKDWIGGEILDVYLEYWFVNPETGNETYYKVWVDIKTQKLNDLLKP